jgi:predicted  nucleic acid-binding Zn-ribbon protein
VDAWGELLTKQGHDLERERRARSDAEHEAELLRDRVRELEAEVTHLKKQRAQLATALEAASAAARAEFGDRP